jgi:ribosomal protein S18 acetylase RimI-like enzyme
VTATTLRRRAVEPADADVLFAIFAATREEELALVPWSAEEKKAFLRMQFDAQERHYRAAYPSASFELVFEGNTVVGRLYVDRGPEAVHVIDIAVLPEHRGRGIGTALLEEVVAAGRPVRLHVDRFSRARRLYERLGFREVEDRGVYVLLERAPLLS